MIHIIIVSAEHLYLCAEIIATALSDPRIKISIILPSQCIIEKCSAQHIDLVIFLSLSPYFASMNIIEYMRRELQYRPIIYVIAHSHLQATILMLLECGVDQYISFPLNIYQLRKKVYSITTKLR